MLLKIKKLVSDAVIPKYASKAAAGLDLTAVSKEKTMSYIEYDTGLAMQIPEGHVGLLFPRSSVSTTGLMLANSVGVIDADYIGPVKLRFKDIGPSTQEYNIGDRVGQLVIVPLPFINIEEVDTLTETERGSGAYGSTGK